MLRAEHRYTRFVTLAKIVLPLVAVALLSSLFLLARSPETTTAIPYSESELAEIIRDERLQAPEYRGVLDSGAAISLDAASARPDPDHPTRTLARTIRLAVSEQPGADILIRAGIGFVDASRAVAGEGIEITHSDGFTLETWGGWAALDGLRAETDGRVQLSADHLELTAGKLTFSQSPKGKDQLLVFTGGVKLVYDPGTLKD